MAYYTDFTKERGVVQMVVWDGAELVSPPN